MAVTITAPGPSGSGGGGGATVRSGTGTILWSGGGGDGSANTTFYPPFAEGVTPNVSVSSRNPLVLVTLSGAINTEFSVNSRDVTTGSVYTDDVGFDWIATDAGNA